MNLDRTCDMHGEPTTAKYLIAGWASKVTWLRQESDRRRNVAGGQMIYHDFIGLLHWRNRVQWCFEGLELTPESQEWDLVGAFDSHFIELTAPDHLGSLGVLARDLMTEPSDGAWWRRRIPIYGPIGFEFAAVIRALQKRRPDFHREAQLIVPGAVPVVSEMDPRTEMLTPRPRDAQPDSNLPDFTPPDQRVVREENFAQVLSQWARSLNSLRAEVRSTPAYLEGSMSVGDYMGIVLTRHEIQKFLERSRFTEEDAEVAVLEALDAYFFSLTVPDAEEVLATVSQLPTTEPDSLARWIRVPKGGSICFELTAAARRVRGIYLPFDD